MILSYKYRAYPKGEVEAKAVASIDAARYVYNWTLEQLNKGETSYYDLQNRLPGLKKDFPLLKLPYSHMLQITARRAFDNISALAGAKKAGRRVGKLRFKSRDRFKSIRYNTQGYSVDVGNSIVSFAKIGAIPFEMHRPLPKGEIIGVVLKHSEDIWYVFFQIETTPTQKEPTGRVVGMDLGLSSYVVDSDGHRFDNPRYMRRSEERVKELQRILSQKQKGSKNQEKARKKLSDAHEKIENQRSDHAHKLSRYYVDSYDVIVVEDLDVKEMIENGFSGLRKSIHDAGWSRFLRYLSYKAEGAGRKMIKVEPRGTTQRCSSCGALVPKTLSDRFHDCPECGYVVDRDYNSARNILIAGVGHAEELAEPRPLLTILVEQALAMRQEAHML